MRISDWSSDVCSSDLIGSRLAPHTFTVGGSHKKANESYGAALIDDDTPTPEHAVFRWSSLRRVLLAGGALWLASMALLMVAFGWQHTFTQMGRSEEHTSELQSLMRISYDVFCLKNKNINK